MAARAYASPATQTALASPYAHSRVPIGWPGRRTATRTPIKAAARTAGTSKIMNRSPSAIAITTVAMVSASAAEASPQQNAAETGHRTDLIDGGDRPASLTHS